MNRRQFCRVNDPCDRSIARPIYIYVDIKPHIIVNNIQQRTGDSVVSIYSYIFSQTDSMN